MNQKNRTKQKYRTVPSEDDWGNYQCDLDQEYAHKMFPSRTKEEMVQYFCDNPIMRTEDLYFMPEIPFRYYMIGYMEFMVDEGVDKGDEASDAASCFLRLVLRKLENHPRHIMPIMPELLPAIDYVARNQNIFEASEKIYGSFVELRDQITALYESCGGIAYSDQLNAFLKK